MWSKNWKILLVYYVIGVCADYHDLIYDYFMFKKAPNVIGFSCNSFDEDISFFRRLNAANIKLMLFKLNNDSINRTAQTDYYKLGIFMDIRCYDNEVVATALSEAARYRLYGELHFWLILSYSLKNVLEVINDNSFGISTDFVVAFSHTSDRYTLYDIYNPWKQGKGQLHINRLASWDVHKGLNLYLMESKIRRRRNLGGMIFRTAFYDSKYKPENMGFQEYLEKSEKNPIDGWAKFGYIILQIASEMFNFSINIKLIDKWEKGDTIGPVSHALYKNDIDISGNPLRMSSSRLGMSRVVYPSWPLRSCFLFRSPQPDDIKFAVITGPFETQVWYFIVLTASISFMVFVIFLKFEADENITHRFSDSLLLIFGVISSQSTTIYFKNMSTRIAFLSLLVLGYFINNYYSACIVSARLDEAIFKINDSLNELAKTGLKVASEPFLFYDLFIKENQWETRMFYTQRWIMMPENERFMLPDKGMQLVKQGSHAYHTWPDVAYPYVNRFYTNREICELTEVNLVRLADNAVAVTHNSTVVELMKVGFSRLTEHGIKRRWLNWLTAKKPICRTDILSASSIPINEFAPHLFIWIIGLILAAIIYEIEIYIYNCKYKVDRQTRLYDYLNEEFSQIILTLYGNKNK